MNWRSTGGRSPTWRSGSFQKHAPGLTHLHPPALRRRVEPAARGGPSPAKRRPSQWQDSREGEGEAYPCGTFKTDHLVLATSATSLDVVHYRRNGLQ